MAVSGVRLPAAWNYGAVERALRNAANRGDRCIFSPEVGQLFDSPQEAFEFYNMYSWEVGFGIRFGRSRENKGGRRSMQDIVCACEGSAGAVDGRSVRCGCRAMIRLLRQEDDSWAVSRVISEHTHPLARSTGERRKWKSHSRIDQMSRDLVMHLRNNNVQISRVCSIVGSLHGPSGYIPFSRQTMRSLCGRLAQESIEGDIEKTVSMFQEIRLGDPGLVVKIDSDELGRIRSLFWAHGSSKSNYGIFGDVVTFDTTYRTNLYNLPFGLFVGVNHHFQSIVFGAVLLTEETTESFRWAFRTFVDAMGADPQTILTDQCQAMRNAISCELPRTRHRWCKWHVLKKAKETLGPVYTKNGSFKKKFHNLIDEMMSTEEFEQRWSTLVHEYGLQANQFIIRGYEHRKMWAKPYFADTFCAGMTSTQRSESANHMLKTYIPRAAPMHLFVSQYARLVADREADEGREDHATSQVTPSMHFGVPIETHAAGIYTRNLFAKFSGELFKSGSFCCNPLDDRSFIVSRISTCTAGAISQLDYKVSVCLETKMYQCECKMFEHVGMPCSHILKVLVHAGAKEIPASLVLTRWTMKAKASTEADTSARSAVGPDIAALHSILYNSAMELVSMGRVSRQAFEVALSFVTKGKSAIASMTVIGDEAIPVPSDENGMDAEGDGPTDSVLRSMDAPPRVRSRGRPRQSRFKSPIESPGARKRKTRPAVEDGLDNGNVEDAISGGHDDNRSGKRKCHLCGEKGHYKSTCGRKSSYTAK